MSLSHPHPQSSLDTYGIKLKTQTYKGLCFTVSPKLILTRVSVTQESRRSNWYCVIKCGM